MNKSNWAEYCLLVICLLWPTPLMASDQKAIPRGSEPPTMDVKGRKFSSGASIEKALPGVSFIVPLDWDAVQPEGEEIILLNSKKVSALGWAFVASKSEEPDWENRLNGQMPFMHRLLNPSAKATRDKGTWRNTFVDADDPNYIGWGVALPGKLDSHLLYFLICDSLVKAYCEKAMDQLLRTTQTN